MRNIKKLIIIEVVIFIVAGLITVLIGKFTVDSYGTVLLFCGIGAMAIAIATQTGSRHRSMPYSYKPKISVSDQHLRDKKALESESKFFLNSFMVGIIPVAIGLILKQLPF